MKYRPHRGMLAESMAETREFPSRAALVEHIRQELADFSVPVLDEHLHIKPYGYDERIDWDTHIVTLDGYGVLGFTDSAPPKE